MLGKSAWVVVLSSGLVLGAAAQGTDATSAQGQQNSPVQSNSDTQRPSDTQQNVEPMQQTPTYRVNVVSRSTSAVDYRHRSGSTEVQMKGTELQPSITGKAKVDSKAGRLEIGTELEHMRPASTYGPQYLTYVL